MKKVGLPLLGLLAFFLLLFWLNREDDVIPHVLVKPDTLVVEPIVVGDGDNGNAALIGSSEPEDVKINEKVVFLGKPFAKCMSIVYEIDNSIVNKMENNAFGIQFIDATVNGVHHVLYFDEDICVSDEIQK
jgi:hypothetical protein